VQYAEEANSTWEYVFSKHFQIYAQWLNPGHDGNGHWDRLGLVNILMHVWRQLLFPVNDNHNSR